MKHRYLFEMGKTNTVSNPFSVVGPILVAGFNLKPAEYEKNQDGTLKEYFDCDKVTFERLLYDDIYDITKCDGINEAGIIAMAPVREGCGETVKVDHCNNTVWLSEPGVYRAIYHGDGRPDAAVIYYNMDGK